MLNTQGPRRTQWVRKSGSGSVGRAAFVGLGWSFHHSRRTKSFAAWVSFTLLMPATFKLHMPSTAYDIVCSHPAKHSIPSMRGIETLFIAFGNVCVERDRVATRGRFLLGSVDAMAHTSMLWQYSTRQEPDDPDTSTGNLGMETDFKISFLLYGSSSTAAVGHGAST